MKNDSNTQSKGKMSSTSFILVFSLSGFPFSYFNILFKVQFLREISFQQRYFKNTSYMASLTTTIFNHHKIILPRFHRDRNPTSRNRRTGKNDQYPKKQGRRYEKHILIVENLEHHRPPSDIYNLIHIVGENNTNFSSNLKGRRNKKTRTISNPL